tara:strand:- start:230 stop:655 length:426 start_codon:yes stop_codon:yes gene_type:complete
MVKKTLCTCCGKEKSNDSKYRGTNWTCTACAQKELQQLRKDTKKLEEKIQKQAVELRGKIKSIEGELTELLHQKDDMEVELSRSNFDLEQQRKINFFLKKEVEDLRDINRIKEEEILFVYNEMERIRTLTNRGYGTLISAN